MIKRHGELSKICADKRTVDEKFDKCFCSDVADFRHLLEGLCKKYLDWNEVERDRHEECDPYGTGDSWYCEVYYEVGEYEVNFDISNWLRTYKRYLMEDKEMGEEEFCDGVPIDYAIEMVDKMLNDKVDIECSFEVYGLEFSGATIEKGVIKTVWL